MPSPNRRAATLLTMVGVLAVVAAFLALRAPAPVAPQAGGVPGWTAGPPAPARTRRSNASTSRGDVVWLPSLGRARHALGAAVVDGRAWVVLTASSLGCS